MPKFLHFVVSLNFLALWLLELQILCDDGGFVLPLPFEIGGVLLHGLFHIPVGVDQIVPGYFFVFFLTKIINTE